MYINLASKTALLWKEEIVFYGFRQLNIKPGER